MKKRREGGKHWEVRGLKESGRDEEDDPSGLPALSGGGGGGGGGVVGLSLQ